MKNPLMKRLPRELFGEIGKYLVIFLLMLGSIGFVSGFLVADNSMIAAYNESFEKYNIENGNFRVLTEVSDEQAAEIEKLGVRLYENFYVEEAVENESTLRIFVNREEVNRVCLMEGAFPEAADEIAIDRMYADNNQLSVGNSVTVGDQKLLITGLVALPDYSTLFSDNNDSMFDSVKFGVAVMNEEGFQSYGDTHLRYSYSWLYEEEPENEMEEKEQAEELMKGLAAVVTLEDFIPRFLNQAIMFTGEDMGSDKAMMIVLLDIVIAIMAFVFGVTISNTISKEAGVIGTLRASGYTKGELLRHYMTMPLFITVAGAVIGNILGYSVFRLLCVQMYYNSYSLPTYETLWNGEAFVSTTVIPLILMFVITAAILWHKLSLTPLQFIRRDLKKNRKRRAFKLNPALNFFSRFRIRIILQNVSSYVTLFVGIIFANLLLMFGLLLPSILDHFQEEVISKKLCEYQYILQVPMDLASKTNPLEALAAAAQLKLATDTANEDAEKFGVYSLKTPEGRYESEQILIYGVEEESRYISADFAADGVYVSIGYAEKFDIEPGDTITLQECYSDGEYEFSVAGVYDYPGALSVFMSRSEFNRVFGYGDDAFGGYFSDSEITDIDEKYIASVIDEEALTKISRQLDVSMGNMMILVDGFAVVMFMILIYLLSKIIIEKNESAISMVKILGYTDKEISRLYIMATSLVVVACLLLSLPIEYEIIKILFKAIIMSMLSGWLAFYVDPVIYVKMFLLGIVTYAVVAMLEYRRIRSVPMSEALKNAE